MEKDINKIIEEFKVTHGRQQLSLDGADKVVGGICVNCQDIRTEDDLEYYVYTFIANIEKIYGKNVAANIVYSQFPTHEIKYLYIGGGLNDLYNLLGQRFLDGRGVH